MIKNFNLIQKENTLENELFVNIKQGETISLNLKKLNFEYASANIKLNNIFIGNIKNRQIGIHSSKLKEGYNELSIDFLDENKKLINNLKFQFVVSPVIETESSIQEQYNKLLLKVEAQRKELAQLKAWKNEIDNERSGF